MVKTAVEPSFLERKEQVFRAFDVGSCQRIRVCLDVVQGRDVKAMPCLREGTNRGVVERQAGL